MSSGKEPRHRKLTLLKLQQSGSMLRPWASVLYDRHRGGLETAVCGDMGRKDRKISLPVH